MGSGVYNTWGVGYTIHTNPGRRLRLGLVGLYVMLPLAPTSQIILPVVLGMRTCMYVQYIHV